MVKKLCFTAWICILFITTQAQQWSWAADNGRLFLNGTNNNGNNYIIRTNATGDLFMAYTFTGTAMLGQNDTTFTQDTSDYWNRGNIVARLTSGNQLVWARHIDGTNTYLQDMTTDAASNTYVLGAYAVNLVFDDMTLADTTGGYHTFLAGYDATGNRMWLRTFAAATGFGNYVDVDNNGDLVYAVALNDTLVVRKISPLTGTTIWKNNILYDIPGMNSCNVRGVSCGATNDVYLVGDFGGDTLMLNNTQYYQDTGYQSSTFIIKLNSLGQMQHVEIIRGARNTQFGLDATDNIFMTGTFDKKMVMRQDSFLTAICTSTYCEDQFLARLNTTGSVVWAKTGYSGLIYGGGLDVMPNGDFYYAGRMPSYTDTLTFDAVVLTESQNREAPYVIKFNSGGTAQWGIKNEGGYLSGAYSIDVAGGTGQVYLAGSYQDFYDQQWFGNDTMPYTYTHNDLFIARIAEQTTGQQPIASKTGSVIFPNPSSGAFTITQVKENSSIKVFDLLGNVVSTSAATKPGSYRIDLGAEKKGIYFIEITSGNERTVKKVILE